MVVVSVGASAGTSESRGWLVDTGAGTEVVVVAYIPAEAGCGCIEGSTVAEVVVEIAGSVGMVVTSVVVVVPYSVKMPVLDPKVAEAPDSVKVPVASDVEVVVEVSDFTGISSLEVVVKVLDSAGIPVDLGSEIVVEVSDSTGISHLRVLVGILDAPTTSSPRAVVKPPDSTGIPDFRVEVEVSDSVRTPVILGSEIVVDVGVSVALGFEVIVGVLGSVGT